MTLTLIDKRIEVLGVTTFIFQLDHPITWQAGQYVVYTLPHDNPDERGLKRFFTIAAPPQEGMMRITTRITQPASSFKTALDALPIGGTIEATAPMGNFTLAEPISQYIFIAGGIGITPFRAMLLDLDQRGMQLPITLLYANRDHSIIFKDELDELALRHPELNINYIIDPQMIDATKIQAVSGWQQAQYYISGPEPMVKAMERLLQGLGIPGDQVKRDYFPGYAT